MILVQPEWVFLPDALQMDYYGTFSDPHVRENQLDKSEEQSWNPFLTAIAALYVTMSVCLSVGRSVSVQRVLKLGRILRTEYNSIEYNA